MNHNDHLYHRERERHCRSMAKRASDPDVRRRHRELAELHARQAALHALTADTGSQPHFGREISQ